MSPTLFLLITFATMLLVSSKPSGPTNNPDVYCYGETGIREGCSSRGVCFNINTCHCFSGYWGKRCESAPSPRCEWRRNRRDRLDHFTLLDTSSLAINGSSMILSLNAPIVKGRANMTMYIQDRKYKKCHYPGPYAFNELREDTFGAYGCHNRLTYRIPWEIAKTCGWEVTQEGDDYVYRAKLYIEYHEKVVANDWDDDDDETCQKEERSFQRWIPLHVRFKKNLIVTTTCHATTPLALYAAVVDQEFKSGTPNTARFEVMTSLPFPYLIDFNTPISVSPPRDIFASVKDISTAGECLKDQACVQRLNVPITVGRACTLTGEYKIPLKIKCHPLASTCPLKSDQGDALLTIVANSEKFCSFASVDIDLKGYLESFNSSSYEKPATTFAPLDPMYFLVKVMSKKTSLRKVVLRRVHYTDGNNTKILYDQGVITPQGKLEKFELGPSGAYSAGFHFTSNSLNATSQDGIQFGVTAIVNVFHDPLEGSTLPTPFSQQTVGFFMDESLDPDSQESKYANTIKMKPRTSDAKMYHFSLVLVLICSLITLFL